jgi:hypothetical protein
MARRKNTKRIDPRYFLKETVNRNDEVLKEEGIEEGWKEFAQGAKDTFRDVTKGRQLGKTRQIRQDKEAALDYEAGRADREKEAERARREKRGDEMSMVQRLAQAQRQADRDGGSSSGSDDAIYNVFGGSKARMAQDRADKRQRADTARRRQKVKDDIEMDKWKNRSRLRNQELGEIEEGLRGKLEPAFVDWAKKNPKAAKALEFIGLPVGPDLAAALEFVFLGPDWGPRGGPPPHGGLGSSEENNPNAERPEDEEE